MLNTELLIEKGFNLVGPAESDKPGNHWEIVCTGCKKTRVLSTGQVNQGKYSCCYSRKKPGRTLGLKKLGDKNAVRLVFGGVEYTVDELVHKFGVNEGSIRTRLWARNSGKKPGASDEWVIFGKRSMTPPRPPASIEDPMLRKAGVDREYRYFIEKRLKDLCDTFAHNLVTQIILPFINKGLGYDPNRLPLSPELRDAIAPKNREATLPQSPTWPQYHASLTAEQKERAGKLEVLLAPHIFDDFVNDSELSGYSGWTLRQFRVRREIEGEENTPSVQDFLMMPGILTDDEGRVTYVAPQHREYVQARVDYELPPEY